MKRCPYCGNEYPDEASECAIDGQALDPYPPEGDPIKDDSHHEPRTVILRTFSSHEPAQLAVSFLEAHGIACWVKADDCGGMYPNLTAPGGVRLLVCVGDAEEAAALLNTQASPAEMSKIEAEAVASTPPETGAPKRLAIGQMSFGLIVGVILGIFFCLIYQRANELGTKTFYHYGVDGKPDEAWTYQDGRLIELMRDRNHDGRWDEWDHYDGGRLSRSEYDNNFDGRPDVWWTFSDDGNDILQQDLDFNGVPDEFCVYSNRIAQQLDIKPDGSEHAITREMFRNGVLTEVDRGGDSNGNFKEKIRYDAFFNPIGTEPINTNPIVRPDVRLPD